MDKFSAEGHEALGDAARGKHGSNSYLSFFCVWKNKRGDFA